MVKKVCNQICAIRLRVIEGYNVSHQIVFCAFHTSQAAQTHVAMEGCNVIYITYVTRAGVALQATVENIRDFVWEICH